MTKHLANLITVAIMASCVCSASAQSLDTNFTLYVPPHMSLTALQGPRSTAHPGTNGDVTFQNSSWLASTASASGSTVVFTTSTPFQIQANPIYQRDVRLLVKPPFGTGGWVQDVITDQTDYAGGDPEAQVQVSCSGPGFAFIFLDVTFITGDVGTLVGGNYEVTVVGTITAN